MFTYVSKNEAIVIAEHFILIAVWIRQMGMSCDHDDRHSFIIWWLLHLESGNLTASSCSTQTMSKEFLSSKWKDVGVKRCFINQYSFCLIQVHKIQAKTFGLAIKKDLRTPSFCAKLQKLPGGNIYSLHLCRGIKWIGCKEH